ncbi:MAG: TlpA family protein disulfide reductase [Elusimicrobia bacterium]|nr:TlpA family protein disulfide reductase [Elusimicrobiota bacterium]
MKDPRKTFFTAIGILALLAVAWRAQRASTLPPISPGAQAPAFALPLLGGGMIPLSRLRGKVVLLTFWATWCDSCREEMPLLEALHRRYLPKGFTVAAASMDREGRAVMGFVAQSNLSFPVLLSDEKTAKAYQVLGLPTSYLIDRKGRIARRYVGAFDPMTLENDIIRQLDN